MKDQCMFIVLCQFNSVVRVFAMGVNTRKFIVFYVTVSQQTSLGNKEDECQHLRTMCETSQKNLEELAEKHQEHLQELANLHEKLQVRSLTHFFRLCKIKSVVRFFY